MTTPAGTDISFRVGDRPVTRQDGDASALRAAEARNLIDLEVELPAGAVRVAPVLETVEGSIAFPPAMWGGYVRWNFFVDTTVRAGGEEWVRGGRLVGRGMP